MSVQAPVNLVDDVDVDAVARVVRASPGVEELYGGFPEEVATYLPGRRLVGVRVGDGAVDVQVCAAWGVPAPQVAAGIRAAVAPLAGGRSVDVMIAAIGDPPGRAPVPPGPSGEDHPVPKGEDHPVPKGKER